MLHECRDVALQQLERSVLSRFQHRDASGEHVGAGQPQGQRRHRHGGQRRAQAPLHVQFHVAEEQQRQVQLGWRRQPHGDRLHQADGVHICEPDPRANEAIFQLAGATLEMPAVGYELPVEPANAKSIRELLRTVTSALRSGGQLDLSAPHLVEAESPPSPEEDDASLPFKLKASVPLGGFQRTDVSRLVVTFGHTSDAPPVQFALLLEPRSGPDSAGH